jgi:hypothetical protein
MPLSASQTFPVTVAAAAVAIGTAPPPAATVGVPYTFPFRAAGGKPPYTWTATGLPVGLTLSTDGILSGTPTTAGPSSLAVTVTDSSP